ncbi:MAG: response regulator [Gammaproteobacteria bacterium]|nr:MAG: response regulator [Gammaproteobacteria bacterium]
MDAVALVGSLLLLLSGLLAWWDGNHRILLTANAGSGALAIVVWLAFRWAMLPRTRLGLWRLGITSLCGLQMLGWGLYGLSAMKQGVDVQSAVGWSAFLLALSPSFFWLPGYFTLVGVGAVAGAITLPPNLLPWWYGGVSVGLLWGGLGVAVSWRSRNRRRADLTLKKTCHDLRASLTEAVARAGRAQDQERHCKEELAHVRQLAEEAGRAKTEFLATISHEIRTPLNGILPILELLRETDLDPEQQRQVHTALSSSRHLLRIINDILDYARAESGKLQLESIELAPRELVQDVLDLMAGNAQRKGLRLKLEIDESVPERVRGDPIRLRQILANLVSNAIKFTEHGEVAVRVERQRVGRREVELRFSVIDTGIGLSHEAAGQLFESFRQADASTTRKHGGTGLGLAICRRLVELMGGTIGVRSRLGLGSTFWFVVPLRRSRHELPDSRKSLEGLRLLACVSDARKVAELISSLTSWGVKHELVQPAELTGRLLETARLGSSWAFEVLLIDVGDDQRRLISLLRKIREEPSLQGLEIIVATGADYSGRRLESEFAVHTLGGDMRPQSLQALLHRLFDVDTAGGEEALHRLELYDDLDLDQGWGVQATAGTWAQGRVAGAGRRVLLVEDNPVNAGVVQKALERLGFACELAENGASALDRLRMAVFDLVLMDCQMPVMDGYEATRNWRRHEARTGGHLPIIAMTANAMHGDREKCLAAGMDDYLAKPVNLRELSVTLERWTQRGGGVDGNEARRADPMAEDEILDGDVLQELREVMGEDFANLLHTYLETSPALVQALSEAVASRDTQAMIIPAHSLKSSSGNMGAARLSVVARELEVAAREGRVDDALAAWNRLPSLYEASCEALKKVLAQTQRISDA